MVKVEDFLKYLCGVLEFRFVTATETCDFKTLYDSLDPNIMHFIPAVSLKSALGMSIGVSIGNVKSVLFITEYQLSEIKPVFQQTVVDNNLPIMVVIIGNSNSKLSIKGLKVFKIKKDFISPLKKASNYINRESKPCAIILDKELLI